MNYWLTIGKIVGPSVGFLVVIYWQTLEKKQYSEKLFSSIETLGKMTWVLEKMEQRFKGDV